jgi:hypothetical protein
MLRFDKVKLRNEWFFAFASGIEECQKVHFINNTGDIFSPKHCPKIVLLLKAKAMQPEC